MLLDKMILTRRTLFYKLTFLMLLYCILNTTRVYAADNNEQSLQTYKQHRKNHAASFKRVNKLYSKNTLQKDNNNINPFKTRKNFLSQALQPIRHNETTLSKVLAGDASTIDLLQSTTEAKQYLQTVTLIRDETFKAIEKILSMGM